MFNLQVFAYKYRQEILVIISNFAWKIVVDAEYMTAIYLTGGVDHKIVARIAVFKGIKGVVKKDPKN